MKNLCYSTLAAVLLMASGCASLPARQGGDDRDSYILFKMDAPERATVYVYAGSERIRLGIVNGPGEEVFRIPYNVTARAGEVTLVARLFASSDAIISEPLMLMPGDDIDIQVQTNLRTMYQLPSRRSLP